MPTMQSITASKTIAVQNHQVSVQTSKQNQNLCGKLVSWVLKQQELGISKGIAAWALIAIPLAVASISVFFTATVLLFIDEYCEQKKELEREKFTGKYKVELKNKDQKIQEMNSALNEAEGTVSSLQSINENLRQEKQQHSKNKGNEVEGIRSQYLSEREAKLQAQNQLKNVNADRAELNTRLKASQEKSEILTQQMRDLTIQYNTLDNIVRTALGDVETQGTSIADHFRDLHEKLEKAHNDLTLETNENTRITDLYHELLKKNENSKSRHKEIAENLTEADKQLKEDDARQKLRALAGQLATANESQSALHAIIAQLRDQLSTANSKLTAATRQAEDNERAMHIKLNEAEKQLTTFDAQIKRTGERIANQNETIRKLTDNVNTLNTALEAAEQLKATVGDLQQRLTTETAKTKKLTEDLDLSRKAVTDAIKERDAVKAEKAETKYPAPPAPPATLPPVASGGNPPSPKSPARPKPLFTGDSSSDLTSTFVSKTEPLKLGEKVLSPRTSEIHVPPAPPIVPTSGNIPLANLEQQGTSTNLSLSPISQTTSPKHSSSSLDISTISHPVKSPKDKHDGIYKPVSLQFDSEKVAGVGELVQEGEAF